MWIFYVLYLFSCHASADCPIHHLLGQWCLLGSRNLPSSHHRAMQAALARTLWCLSAEIRGSAQTPPEAAGRCWHLMWSKCMLIHVLLLFLLWLRENHIPCICSLIPRPPPHLMLPAVQNLQLRSGGGLGILYMAQSQNVSAWAHSGIPWTVF